MRRVAGKESWGQFLATIETVCEATVDQHVQAAWISRSQREPLDAFVHTDWNPEDERLLLTKR